MNIGKETEKIEFKLTTGEKRDAMYSICGILNKHCAGELYFGIDDDGNVKGQQISDNTIKDISRIINEAIEPKIIPTIEVLQCDNKSIIKVSFSGTNRPYNVYGDFVIRVGTENRKMTTGELRKIIKNENYASNWEKEITPYNINQIDIDTLKDFYNNSTSCGRLSIKKFDVLSILTKLELIRDGYLTNGAFALFGKNANIGLKLATYATDNKITFLDLKLINGNIYSLVNEAINYINKNLKYRVEIGKRQRIEIPEIPVMAIREIIVNAFAHANYESLPEIEINIHPGKISIYNPGSFPDGLTPNDFINRDLASYKRNPIIFDVLFRSKDVEKSGTGFQRVSELCNKDNVRWIFRKEAYGFYFEFIRTNSQINIPIKSSLSKNDNQILNIISNNPKISKTEISLKISKSEKTIQRSISNLINSGYIIRIGSNKTGYWEIAKKD